MAVIYDTAIKTSRMQVVVDAIDAGVGSGSIEFLTSGDVLLATVTLQEPCATVSGGALTLNGLPLQDPSIDATGVVAKAQIKDGDGNVKVTGLTVGTSGADIIVSTTSLESGVPFIISGGTITHG